MVSVVISNLTKVRDGLGAQIRKTAEIQYTTADNYPTDPTPLTVDLTADLKDKQLIRVIPESPVFDIGGTKYTLEVINPISGQTFDIKIYEVASGAVLGAGPFAADFSIFFEITQDT